jgi:ABC-type branched-subunit amino acid transport system ATPase component
MLYMQRWGLRIKRILDIAKSLLSNPSLLLVDEPAVGLSPIMGTILLMIEVWQKEDSGSRQ